MNFNLKKSFGSNANLYKLEVYKKEKLIFSKELHNGTVSNYLLGGEMLDESINVPHDSEDFYLSY